MVTRPRSRSVWREPLESTPRMPSISTLVTGCLYATIASVSSPARERRTLRRERSIRSIHGAHSLRERSCHPPAISTSATPRPLSSSPRAIAWSSESTAASSGPSSTSTKVASPTGASLAKRRDSRICCVLGVVCVEAGVMGGSLLFGVDGLGPGLVGGVLRKLLGGRVAAPLDPDRPEQVLLRDLDGPGFEHLQESQERGDLLQAAHEQLEHLLEQR